MKCDKCKADLDPSERHDHGGQSLCEDCYIDILSPVKTCDPWAIHSAKSLEKSTGEKLQLTQTQSKILQILREEGPMTPKKLLERLGGILTQKALESDFAVLRHMEKARAEKTRDGIVLKIW
jgi:hypothetical protein